MNTKFSSKLARSSTSNHARTLQVTTPHGEFTTPAFMPVGTRAFVNHMTPDNLQATRSQIILGGNTYHMLLNPGLEVIQASGGMHRFMDWHDPMLTDSGGYQLFSLSREGKLCKIDERGAHFKHPDTGQSFHMSPTFSIQTQQIIGADIIMAFDQCTPAAASREETIHAMERTHRWLLESIDAHQATPTTPYGHTQALFGIIQGGVFRDLREQSAEFVLSQSLDGIALGGEVIGYDMAKTVEIIDWLRPALPQDKLRYTMGVGLHPQNLLDVVAAGIDIFDCVAPTRNARHGTLYHGHFRIQDNWPVFESEEPRARIAIKSGKYALDQRPIIEGCECYTCQHFTRAYLHHLFKSHATLYYQLACIHNVHTMQAACDAMRECILS